jgi:hypothetical protein
MSYRTIPALITPTFVAVSIIFWHELCVRCGAVETTAYGCRHVLVMVWAGCRGIVDKRLGPHLPSASAVTKCRGHMQGRNRKSRDAHPCNVQDVSGQVLVWLCCFSNQHQTYEPLTDVLTMENYTLGHSTWQTLTSLSGLQAVVGQPNVPVSQEVTWNASPEPFPNYPSC